MTQSKLFNRDESVQTTWQVIGWWEARRVPYNLIVGVFGIITSAMCFITGAITEIALGDAFGIPNPPAAALIAVVLYGLMANLCYTGGWIAELIVRYLWPDEGAAFGKISFFLGVLFSVALTLFPGFLVAGIGGAEVLGHLLRR